MNPGIVPRIHKKAKEERQTFGRWVEDVIEEKLEREKAEKED
jgi:hypothetical protein